MTRVLSRSDRENRYQTKKQTDRQSVWNHMHTVNVRHAYHCIVVQTVRTLFLSLYPHTNTNTHAGIVYFVRPSFMSSGHRLWNTLFLWGISIGMGLMVWGYSVEYYARVFCPTDVRRGGGKLMKGQRRGGEGRGCFD